jgi:dienelactone hydrolase
MSVLPGEGSYVILYGSTAFSAGTRTHNGYVARPDVAGSFPVAMLLGAVTSGTKELCRQLARRGFAAVAMHWRQPGEARDLMRWISAPGTPWADPERVGVIVTEEAAGSTPPAAAYVLLDATIETPVGRPVLGLFGGDGPAAAAARAADKAAGSRWVFYTGAGEGFWDPTAAAYDRSAAADAVDRIVAFLGDALVARAA